MSKTVNSIDKKPYQSGLFPVSHGHKLYFERWGDPQGIPVIFLHGGPGSSISPNSRRFFRARDWNVLFFDQRGSGRSQYKELLAENNTQALVSDIESLMNSVGWKRACIFGRSWGSTLALTFAIRHPQRVLALNLGSVFLGTKEAHDYAIDGPGRYMFPEAWEKVNSLVPPTKRKDLAAYYHNKILRGTRGERAKFSRAFGSYEWNMMCLVPQEPTSSATKQNAKQKNTETPSTADIIRSASIASHYASHRYFIAENFILKNAAKLNSVPTSIVHGRYDCICPLSDAVALQRAIKHSTLEIVTAGHNSSDPEMNQQVIESTSRLARLLKRSNK